MQNDNLIAQNGFIINSKKIPFFSPLSFLFGRFFSSFPSPTTNTITEPCSLGFRLGRSLPSSLILTHLTRDRCPNGGQTVLRTPGVHVRTAVGVFGQNPAPHVRTATQHQLRLSGVLPCDAMADVITC